MLRSIMRRFELNKLVRDGVFASMQKQGQEVQYKKLDDEKYDRALRAKLVEEAKEFAEADTGSLEELSDVLEVVELLAAQDGTNFGQLRAAQLAKRQKAGGYAGRIFVESVTMDDNDPWAAYYAREPARFTEIKHSDQND